MTQIYLACPLLEPYILTTHLKICPRGDRQAIAKDFVYTRQQPSFGRSHQRLVIMHVGRPVKTPANGGVGGSLATKLVVFQPASFCPCRTAKLGRRGLRARSRSVAFSPCTVA